MDRAIIHRLGREVPRDRPAFPARRADRMMWDATTRKPMFLFRLFGLFLFRTAQRTFSA
jgi:hypothetical protein